MMPEGCEGCAPPSELLPAASDQAAQTQCTQAEKHCTCGGLTAPVGTSILSFRPETQREAGPLLFQNLPGQLQAEAQVCWGPGREAVSGCDSVLPCLAPSFNQGEFSNLA